MKKNLLFTLLTLLVSTFAMTASNVKIVVDNPDNVTVQTQSGYGKTLTIEKGGTDFTDLTYDDSPLLITANTGAEITSVVVNGDSQYAGGDGNYRIAVYDNSDLTIDVTTSGSASGNDVKMVDIAGIIGFGDDINGSPFTITYDKNGEWVAPEKDSFNMYSFPDNSTVKITPDAPYTIEDLKFRSLAPIENNKLEDGSVTFKCEYAKFYYQTIYVAMKLKEDAIRFSITVDYGPNLSAALENQREGNYDFLTINTGENKFVCMPENSPLELFNKDGSEILTVTRNGERCIQTGWNGSNGWVFEPLEDGDKFVVTTKGKPVKVQLKAETAPLQYYFYETADGTKYTPAGLEDTIDAFNGETIYVSPRPGTSLEFILTSNGGQTDYANYFQVAEGADGANPMCATIYGNRAATGVVINVDDAGRVKIVQEGGRGDALALESGKNSFELADLKNALAISSTEGNQIVSVSVNGDAMAPNAESVFIVNAADSDVVDIISRKNPVDVAMTLKFDNEEANASWLVATIDGQPQALGESFSMKTYSQLLLKADDGYDLKGVTCSTEGVLVQKLPDSETYSVVVPNTDITAVELTLSMSEMEPEEGYAIVIPKGSDLFYTYYDVDGDDLDKDNDKYTFVRKLEVNKVNQVKIGNYVRVFCKDTQSRFVYVRANGVDVELDAKKEFRVAYVEVKGRTVIEAEMTTPCLAYTNPSFDDEKHVLSGNVYIEADGRKSKEIYPELGQKVKLIAEPAPGYMFDHFEKFYPLTIDSEGIVLDSDEYTFTEEDLSYNFVLFKGVFKVNPDEKSYVVRGTTAWLEPEEGEFVASNAQAMGTVAFINNAGEQVYEFTGIEGDEVSLYVTTSDESIFNEYEVSSYAFSDGFPNRKIQGSKYVINKDDANSEGVIWIAALIRKKSSGVDAVTVNGGLSYNAATATVSAGGEIKVFDMQGKLLTSGEGAVSVETLSKGIYVAVSGDKTLKFVR